MDIKKEKFILSLFILLFVFSFIIFQNLLTLATDINNEFSYKNYQNQISTEYYQTPEKLIFPFSLKVLIGISLIIVIELSMSIFELYNKYRKISTIT